MHITIHRKFLVLYDERVSPGPCLRNEHATRMTGALDNRLQILIGGSLSSELPLADVRIRVSLRTYYIEGQWAR